MADDTEPKQLAPIAETREAVVRAREQLADVRRQLAAATGGASPRSILAELAQELAADLASYFDDLPMHRFPGGIRREHGLLKHLWPAVVPHRVVLGRYHSSTIPSKTSSGWTRQYTRVFILALGADGVLRRGSWSGLVQLPDGTLPGLEPLDWDNVMLRRIPTSMLILRRWSGSTDPRDVAEPGRVLDALTAIANHLAAESKRDLALLERFL